MDHFLKSPAGSLHYTIDWQATQPGGTVVQSDWQVRPGEPGGVSVASSVLAALRTGAQLSGGIAGRVYHVTNAVQFIDGQRDARTLCVRIEDQ